MSRRYGFILNIYFVAVFVGIGGLQMYRVNAGFLTNSGADLFAPPYLYLMFRGGRLRLRSLTALAVVPRDASHLRVNLSSVIVFEAH